MEIAEFKGPFYRRKEASRRVTEVFGSAVRIAPATLAALAVRGGGPPIVYWRGIPVYPEGPLLQWVRERLTPARSTAERPKAIGPVADDGFISLGDAAGQVVANLHERAGEAEGQARGQAAMAETVIPGAAS